MKIIKLILFTIFLVLLINIHYIWQKHISTNNDYYLRLLSLGDFEPCKDISVSFSLNNGNDFKSICANFNSGLKENTYAIYQAGFYNLASISIDSNKSSSSDYQILLSGITVRPFIDINSIINLFPMDQNIINAVLKIAPDNEILLKRIDFLKREVSL